MEEQIADFRTFLVLNLAFYIVNSVGRLNFQSDGLASQGLDKNLHAEREKGTMSKSKCC